MQHLNGGRSVRADNRSTTAEVVHGKHVPAGTVRQPRLAHAGEILPVDI